MEDTEGAEHPQVHPPRRLNANGGSRSEERRQAVEDTEGAERPQVNPSRHANGGTRTHTGFPTGS